jgi:hypothetical protein
MRVLPIPGSTLSALRRHALANSFKTSNAVVVAWSHLLDSLWFGRNQSIALRCRGAGAVQSINRVDFAMPVPRRQPLGCCHAFKLDARWGIAKRNGSLLHTEFVRKDPCALFRKSPIKAARLQIFGH